ncbi:unnamed protein product, partial [Ilex paraguariensis]
VHLCTCTGGQTLLLGHVKDKQHWHPARRVVEDPQLMGQGLPLVANLPQLVWT